MKRYLRRLWTISSRKRETYAGPLEVGEDLTSFEIGDTVTVHRQGHWLHRFLCGTRDGHRSVANHSCYFNVGARGFIPTGVAKKWWKIFIGLYKKNL
jgi:hypothetical protein